MEKSILEALNDSQRRAVEHIDGPSIVIAGAGSGKTRVLTYKIAHLLNNGFEPCHILALTFTNKAATEMKTRIGHLVSMERARYLNMGTFHSVFSHILRTEAERIGFGKQYTIYDENDSRSLCKVIIKEMGLDDKIYKPATVHARISMAKNHLILPAQYAKDSHALQHDRDSRMPAMSHIYTTYCERCRKSNVMDFDDLLVYTHQLFNEHDDVLQKYRDRFRFILVDEYQDTNFVQQSIVTRLAEAHRRICVVGDDAQSIYGFRGANIDNILDFQEKFVDAEMFKLEQNYRSTQRIVLAANSLIKHNRRQIPKDIFSRNDKGERLTLKPAYSDTEEAMIVCNDIRRIHRADACAYSDFAVLYRTNSQSRSFEEQLRKQGIPYRIYGGLSFYQRKEIKDVIAYFRLVANPDDEEALRRIINYPARGIGDTTVGKILSAANAHGVSPWTVIKSPARYGADVRGATVTKIEAFRTLIMNFVEAMPQTDAYELGKDIMKDSGITADIFGDTTPEGLSRQENIEEFLGAMQDFVSIRQEEGRGEEVSIADFLQEVALLTDLDSDDGNDSDRVTLMTIHSAKGLEFPNVFIVGMEENIFPSPRACDSQRELEEERRLLYVAITRAERRCILTCARNRFRYGRVEFDTPSRFLREIDPQYMTVESEMAAAYGQQRYGRRGGYDESRYQNSRPVADRFRADPQPRITAHRPIKPATPPASFRRAPASQPIETPSVGSTFAIAVQEGDVIEHERFGIGRILRMEGTGENTKATVEFKHAGAKQLLLKFARFKKVNTISE